KTNNLTILDASYSANPYGVIADLDYLKIYPEKKIIIMPSLIELGKESEQAHIEIGEKIGKVCDLAIVTTNDNFKEVEIGTLKANMKSENILLIEDVPEIVQKINSFCKKEQGKCVVLLEGRVPKRLIQELK
ncbi:MAG: hypothetical protein U9Q16_01345, partial [Patescibacteria group bacterium]|nr:hypothetical protein [Patescibacteria group bacterium]